MKCCPSHVYCKQLYNLHHIKYSVIWFKKYSHAKHLSLTKWFWHSECSQTNSNRKEQMINNTMLDQKKPHKNTKKQMKTETNFSKILNYNNTQTQGLTHCIRKNKNKTLSLAMCHRTLTVVR